mmetsp:Transcript_20044/g.58579  ORF Transcript_20044/g.58579 Transcript_20044/m.58579 type:complete len:164 (-) Transcript_20044:49-540(-)
MEWPGESPFPEVYHDHLDAADIARLTKGVQLVRQIFASPPLGDYVTREVTPGRDIASDEDIEEFVVSSHTSNSHWCCSARMGPDPKYSAVSGSLQIHGTSNVYVADASIFPSIPNGNVHSSVVAVASIFARRLGGEVVGGHDEEGSPESRSMSMDDDEALSAG